MKITPDYKRWIGHVLSAIRFMEHEIWDIDKERINMLHAGLKENRSEEYMDR